jgi:tetratricopeptide (TPR) repeat protein/DNA-binding CsgD family transcriptional regulator
MIKPSDLRKCVLITVLLFGGLGYAGAQMPANRDSMLSVFRSHTPGTEEKSILCARIAASYSASDTDSALWYASQGLSLARSVNFKEGIVKNEIELGNSAIQTNQLDKSRDHFLAAAKLSGDSPAEDVSKIYLMLGYIFDLQGMYNKAMEFYLKGVKLAETNNDLNFLPKYFNNIAVIYDLVGDKKRSIAYYQKSADIFKKQNDYINYANTLTNLGSLYFANNLDDSSAYYYQLALPIHLKLNNYYGLMNLYIGLGDLENRKGSLSKSQEHYLKASSLLDSIPPSYIGSKSYSKADIYSGLGKNSLNMGHYAEARQFLYEAYKIAGKEAMLSIQVKTSLSISDLHQKTGAADSALAWYKVYKLLDDSLNLDKNKNLILIQEMEIGFKKEKETQKLYQLKKEQEARNTILIFTAVVLIMLIILLVILMFFLYQRSKAIQSELKRRTLELEKENLQKDLDHKSRELTTSVMYLLRKNELLEDITPKLREANSGLDPESQKQVRTIIRELESSTSKDAWTEFEIRFQDVHGDFYSRLSKEFPLLSPNELKLCAFLRLNMSSKEIASIIFRTEHSIKIARYRLRKKLGLDHDENIVSFLARF